MPAPWLVQYYVDLDGGNPFRRWADGLPQEVAVFVIAEVERRLSTLGPDVCRDHWGRSLGGGLYEFRIRRRELLLRVFFGTSRGRVVVVLGGFDKGAHPKRQDAAIATARRRLADHRRRFHNI
ncbi:MAG: type II toxin-antitoxin system RelE/ParE family toxin [Gaiellales bacterium]